MRVILPIPVTDLTLTDTDIPEDDYDEWSDVVTYDRGDYVISTDTHTVYRSLTDSNLDNDPDLEAAALADPLVDNPDPVNWQIMGATNLWKLFDEKPSQRATQATSMSFEITPGVFIGGISGFNLSANTVNVKVYADPDLLYDETITLMDESGVVGWLSYFTEPFVPQTEFVLADLPVLGTPRIVVTFEGSVVGVGQVVMGTLIEIGDTTVKGSGFSGLDFSYVANDEFGNLTTVRREGVKMSNYSVAVSTPLLQTTYEKLRAFRGGFSAVWVGDEDARLGANNYGFLRNYDLTYQTREISEISLQVQGIA